MFEKAMFPAARMSRWTAFFHLDELEMEHIFTNPEDERTHADIIGRIG
jgi:ABC-type phosphate transport system ATPase subunit